MKAEQDTVAVPSHSRGRDDWHIYSRPKFADARQCRRDKAALPLKLLQIINAHPLAAAAASGIFASSWSPQAAGFDEVYNFRICVSIIVLHNGSFNFIANDGIRNEIYLTFVPGYALGAVGYAFNFQLQSQG